jgi:hypothetical protein
MITKAGVPSNKVIAGVTSYGRSFQMTTPGCYGPMCTFTGPSSGAEPGPCTGTPSYIADAEIKQIAADAGRVNYVGFDAASQTDILVYDGDQWVGWMSPSTKATRTAIYQSLDLGGVSDWATDLEDYRSSPNPEGWGTFINNIKLYGDPYIEGNRTGNWTSLTCTDPAVVGLATFTSSERWGMLDCDDAWTDALNVWTTIDNVTHNLNFPLSVWNTFHAPENSACQVLLIDANCDTTLECTDTVGEGSGPAGYLVLNSLIEVHEVRTMRRRRPYSM